jgi:DNA helicase-2/ATP-dependent DNA helicase PcrA
VADQLIGNNLQRKTKSLWTQNADGTPVRVVECEDCDQEASMVAGEIQQKLRAGADPGDIAVFYRVNSLSRAIEEAFLRGGLQYQIARGVEFYNRKEIKDVLAYLRVLINPADEIALLRIINTPPRGIGDATVEKLAHLAAERKHGIFELLGDEAALSEAGRSTAKVKQFAELIRTLTPATTMPAPQALDFVMSHSGLRALYRGEEEADQSEGEVERWRQQNQAHDTQLRTSRGDSPGPHLKIEHLFPGRHWRAPHESCVKFESSRYEEQLKAFGAQPSADLAIREALSDQFGDLELA